MVDVFARSTTKNALFTTDRSVAKRAARHLESVKPINCIENQVNSEAVMIASVEKQ